MLGWELPPHNSGGLGIACYQLCKALAKNDDVDIEFIVPYLANHDIDFMTITAAYPQDVSAVFRAGIAYDSHKYILKDGSEKWLDIFDQQQIYEEAVARLAEFKSFDIVHAHDWLTFRAALRVKEIKGCPLILHVHSVESDRAGTQHGNPFVKEIEGLAMHMADRVIAVSRRTKNNIVSDYGIPADKIEVVHNSIEPDDITPLDEQNSYHYLTTMRKHGYRVIVNVGRMTIQKGLPNLLRAAKEVVAQAPKTFFLIVGSGEQYYELIELAAELGIGPNVFFTDFQRGQRWRDAFAVGDLFVMPSVSEPFGLTPLEAIGYGTPAMVSKQSGISEILTHCLKVDFWDVNEMANQITAVVQNEALHDELLRNSHQEYEKMSWNNASDMVADLYRQHAQGAVL
jgi:glycogen(starch) synthase